MRTYPLWENGLYVLDFSKDTIIGALLGHEIILLTHFFCNCLGQ
jgi:hypothetical protein